MATGLVRQSSSGSLSTQCTASKGSFKRSNSLSSIVSGTSELGYSVARSSLNGSSASSIKASMLGKRPDVPAVMASSRKSVDVCSLGAQATPAFTSGFGTDAKRSSVDLGTLPRSAKGGGFLEACTVGDLSALRMALEGGSMGLGKPDVNSTDSQGKSALMLTVMSGNKPAVEYLLGKRADVNAADSARKTALHHASKRARGRRTAQAIVSTDQMEVVGLLLRAKGSIEAQDSNGCTPLMLAVANSDAAVAEGLLRAGAKVNTADSEGQTCLDYAVSFELTEMAQLLKRAEELHQSALAPPPRPVQEPRPTEVAHPSPTPASVPSAPAATGPTYVEEARPRETDEGADEKSKRKAEKAEKKKKKHAKEHADEGRGDSPEAREEADAKQKAEAEQEQRRAKEEAKRKADDAKRAAEELARQEAESRERALAHLQELVKSSSAVAAGSESEEVLKELKAAIKAAQTAGVEEQRVQEAEAAVKDLKSRGKAAEKLKLAMEEKDIEKLKKAIAKAEEANVSKDLLSEAKAAVAQEEPRQRAREGLRAAGETASLEDLRAALAVAASVGLGAAELAPFEQLKVSLERRAEVEEVLRKAIEGRSVEALRAALKMGAEANLDSQLMKDAEVVLKEEEPKQKARELLREACQQRDIAALREALQAAEAANLDASECAEAAEALRQEEAKKMALEGVNTAMEDVKGVDMTNIDALREAKEKLGSAIQAAMKAGLGEAHLAEAEKRRKKIHNTIEDLKGSIRVFCRIRPLSSKEKDQGDTNITKSTDSMSLEVEGGGTFSFDAVFTPGTQEEVFEDCRDLVQSAVDGYNVTMFAYGQTGAGKTHTMYGAPGLEGTAPRTIQEIYRVIDENSSRFEYEVRGSMLELYTNTLQDLLNKSEANPAKSKLNIRQEKSGAVVVEGLTDELCSAPEELSSLLDRGNEQRKVASTNMNNQSSRSHMVLIIRIKSTNRETKDVLQGKILICDLAGSERLKKSQVSEQEQTEAIEINKSLTALGDVIEALTKGGKQKVVPYRNHKLTQLMQDSLGGTAKTLMFVNCSPANSNLDETVNSLRYATRAKKITNTTKRASVGS